MPFIDNFISMLPDEITIIPGTVGISGDFVASGEQVIAPCRITGRVRRHLTSDGHEVVTTVDCLLGGVYGATVNNHRYTLQPTRYAPRVQLVAVGIKTVSDEDGPVYERLMFA